MGFFRLDNDTIVRYEASIKSYLVLHKNKLSFLSDLETIEELHEVTGHRSLIKEVMNTYSIPLNIQVQVTRGCNFSCSFCYASAVNSNNPDVYMAYERLTRIVDIVYDWGVPNIQYVGGETFMHPDFKKLVEYGRTKGLAQTLITNGIIPGQKISEYKSTITTFSKIQISINSIGNNFDEIVGRKIFSKFTSCLSNIAEIHSNVWASFVVTSQSVGDIEPLFELARKSSLCGIRFGLLAPQGRGKTSIDIKQYFDVVSTANIIISRLKIKYQEIKVECHFNSTIDTDQNKLPGGAGVSVLFLNKEGNIYPFPLLEEEKFRLGNVFTDDIIHIWENHNILQELRAKDAIPEVCNSCDTPCPVSSPVMSYLWKGAIGQRLPCLKTRFLLPEEIYA
jgi:radical SAM protein with 4Fe4S-binding SPASM domain